MEKKHLDTMKEITVFVGWSKNKIIDMHVKANFPLKKIGGRWASHTEEINKWWKEHLQSS
jgi:predicted DNA-binding transcriptional regulator AlpA